MKPRQTASSIPPRRGAGAAVERRYPTAGQRPDHVRRCAVNAKAVGDLRGLAAKAGDGGGRTRMYRGDWHLSKPATVSGMMAGQLGKIPTGRAGAQTRRNEP